MARWLRMPTCGVGRVGRGGTLTVAARVREVQPKECKKIATVPLSSLTALN